MKPQFHSPFFFFSRLRPLNRKWIFGLSLSHSGMLRSGRKLFINGRIIHFD